MLFSALSMSAQNYIKIEKEKTTENLEGDTQTRQINYYIFPVYFKDKANSTFSIDKPEQFLSKKAIDRRLKYNIAINQQDLPVNYQYLKILQDSFNVQVLKSSKWLNCAIIRTKDTNIINEILKLSFVISKPASLPKKYKQNDFAAQKIKAKYPKIEDKFDYGFGKNQAKMINVDKLHNLGFAGKGMTIAIFDGGFLNVDKSKAFDSLWDTKRIKGWYDFVHMDSTVFDEGDHGREVLSTIAANEKGFVGTAPEASFYLFETEDNESETQLEEYNWVIAAEAADSVGVDMIHSSLGYSNFDLPKTSYNYKDMNGNTAVSTIGADIAASKGIVVVVSAGNEGDNSWKYITAPSDGDSVFCIGAVDRQGVYADFSSLGPSSDRRIKPLISAQGIDATVQGRFSVTLSSGTSFSGPISAGGIACLMQAFPKATVMDIMEAVAVSGSIADDPDYELGYGIPDLYKAYIYLSNKFNKQ